MLNDDLRRAYHATDFHVFGRQPFIMRPGDLCPGAEGILLEHRCSVGIVLTAWNPMCVPANDEENAAAQVQLLVELERLGLPCLPAEGRGRDTTWPPEASVFIPGIAPNAAQALAARFRQAAFVQVAIGQPAQIVETDFGVAVI